MREVITFADANNDDLKLLGTDDERKHNDLFEELMDVLKRVPSLNNADHLARMPDTQIGESASGSRSPFTSSTSSLKTRRRRARRARPPSLLTTVVEVDVAGEADVADVTDVEDGVAVAATTAAVVARKT